MIHISDEEWTALVTLAYAKRQKNQLKEIRAWVRRVSSAPQTQPFLCIDDDVQVRRGYGMWIDRVIKKLTSRKEDGECKGQVTPPAT
jgi:hypothetical protein